MNLDSFTGPGSTPSRRRFWDKVTQAVNAAQKVAGDNVTVVEHQGSGTLISVPFDNRGRPQPGGATGACCSGSDCTITTEADCAGEFQGPGSECVSCPDPDAPTITITFSGIALCPGFDPYADPNGEFVLDSFGSGQWFGNGNTNDTGTNAITVQCGVGGGAPLQIRQFSPDTQGLFASDTCVVNPPLNALTCDAGAAGEGGTASLSP